MLKVQEGGELRIIKRRQRAFQITGLTWIVERTFAWLGRIYPIPISLLRVPLSVRQYESCLLAEASCHP